MAIWEAITYNNRAFPGLHVAVAEVHTLRPKRQPPFAVGEQFTLTQVSGVVGIGVVSSVAASQVTIDLGPAGTWTIRPRTHSDPVPPQVFDPRTISEWLVA